MESWHAAYRGQEQNPGKSEVRKSVSKKIESYPRYFHLSSSVNLQFRYTEPTEPVLRHSDLVKGRCAMILINIMLDLHIESHIQVLAIRLYRCQTEWCDTKIRIERQVGIVGIRL